MLQQLPREETDIPTEEGEVHNDEEPTELAHDVDDVNENGEEEIAECDDVLDS